MQIIRTATYQLSDHLHQVEELLAPIRDDRSISDAERRQLIGEVLAAANARALSLHASRRRSADATLAPLGAEAFQAHRFHRELARVG
jgi:hypothetical protein